MAGRAALVLACASLALAGSVVEAATCSRQPTNFVLTRHGREGADVAQECSVTHEYHPFPVENYKVKSGWLKEASGLARSGVHDGIFWSHNDGKQSSIFAIHLGSDESQKGYQYKHDLGEVVMRAHVPTQVERQTDWEDIDTGLCPDGTKRSCLWIADTGDNSKRRNRPRVHVVVEPDIDLSHHTAGQGKFYDTHVCSDDVWTLQFTFEFRDEGLWKDGGGSFDIEAMTVSPEGDKFWLFEKKQHWEDNVWGWPRIFESEDVAKALRNAGDKRFIQIKVRELTKFPRACEMAPEAWQWLAKPANSFIAESIIDSEVIASKVYKYKKMHQYGNREGLKDMFMNGTDCSAFPPIFWMITGANLHPKGTRLALQTYSGVFEYEFSTPLNFTELTYLKPKQLGMPRFDQMESVVYSHDGRTLFAVPEALGRKGYQKVQQIHCVPATEAPKLFPDDGTGEEEEEEGLEVASDLNKTAGNKTEEAGGSRDEVDDISLVTRERREGANANNVETSLDLFLQAFPIGR